MRADADGSLRLADLNLAVRHRQALRVLAREVPAAVPLYAALCEQPGFVHSGELAQALRKFLIGRALAPRTWRLIVRSSARLVLPVHSFYCGPTHDAVLDYLRVLEALPMGQEPPARLMWCLLARVANPGHCYEAHFGFLRRQLGGAALAVRHALANRGGLPSSSEISDVLEWRYEAYDTLDKRQRDAGWAWMLGEARLWMQRRRLEIEAAASGPWRAPFMSYEDDGWIATPITSAVALWDEAQAMCHCVFDHLARCRSGGLLAVSIRRSSRRDGVWPLLYWRRAFWAMPCARSAVSRTRTRLPPRSAA